MMKLSDIDLGLFGIRLVRDGSFTSSGSFTRKTTGMLVFIEGEKYIPCLIEESNRFSCVICRPEHIPLIPSHMGVGVSSEPEVSFYNLHNYLAKKTVERQKLQESIVSERTAIHPSAYIDRNVTISDRCVIQPRAIILNGTILEEDVTIGPGCVIGGEGFRFLKGKTSILPIIHTGGVLVKRGVEVQANTCIDKALYSDTTIIGEETKIDNLVHIGHNVNIGKRCLLAACSMIGGSTVIGDDVWIGPNASITDNILIGDSVFIPLGSVVTRNIPSGMAVVGNTMMESSKFFKYLGLNKRGP